MNALVPLESLYEAERGSDLPLPSELATLYGRLQFPLHPGRPYIIGNFVTTLDGVSVKRGGSHLFLRYTFETKEVAT